MNSKQFNILYWLKTTNIFIAIKNILDTISWKKRNYCMHSPQFIKEGCIFQHNIKDSIWVESGTYLGNTTRFLGSFAKHVYSIEPQMNLFEYATWRFNSKKNISILHGLSENILPNLIKNISGDICFWLDGHYSEGITFKGPLSAP